MTGPAGVPDAIVELHRLLRSLGRTVAVAESLTGGLLAGALTTPGGASDVVRGGLVVYATDLKARLAGVDPDLLAARGAVDPDVAVELARGVRERLSADYGLGITGVAGPTEQDGRPVGTVFLAVAGPDGETVAERVFAGDRAAIRAASVQAAVDLLAGVCRAAAAP
ncbi:CinA family protein [Jatrophihabitans sp. YIM 134969]